MSYDIGDQARLAAEFRTTSGTLIDPTTVTLKLKTPAGVETSHAFGTDQAVVKDDTGAYHYDLTLAAAGTYRYRWVATGVCVCAGEGWLKVDSSQFSSP